MKRRVGILFLLLGIALIPNALAQDHRRHQTIPVAVALFCASQGGSAQDHSAHAASPPTLRIVDGSQTPDAISDEKAWQLFLRAFSEPAGPETKQARAKTNAIGLNEADAAVFRSVLATFHSELPRLEQQIQSHGRTRPGTAPYQQVVQLRQAVKRLEVDTQKRLEASLSHEGANQVKEYVKQAKRHMHVAYLPTVPRDKKEGQ